MKVITSRLATLTAIFLVGVEVHATPVRVSRAEAETPQWVQEVLSQPIPSTGADAVWLLKEHRVEPLASSEVKHRERWVFKVLKEGAAQRIGGVKANYKKGDPAPEMRCWVLLGDGKVLLSDPEEDVQEIPAVGSSSTLFSDQRMRFLEPLAAPPGAVVALESSWVEKIDRGASSFTFGDIQRPTLLSRFFLVASPDLGFDFVLRRGEGLTVEKTPRGFSVTGRNLAPLPAVEAPPKDSERLPLVWGRWWSEGGSRGFRSWDDVARFTDKLIIEAVADSEETHLFGAGMRPAEPSQFLNSIERAFKVAARDVHYAAISLGIGGFKPNAPDEVLRQRWGDCKDKATLFRAMVESWTPAAYSVLVRTRDLGQLDTEVPSLAFNHMIAAVALPPGVGADLWSVTEVPGLGRLLFLDATDAVGGSFDLPEGDQGTMALVVTPSGGRLVRLPVQPPAAGITTRSVAVKIDQAGLILDGGVVDRWEGTEAADVRAAFGLLNKVQKGDFIQKYFIHPIAGNTLTSWSERGFETLCGPATREVHFAQGQLGQRSGKMLVLETGKLTKRDRNNRWPEPPRPWKLELGAPFTDVVEMEIELPPGWRPELLPPPMRRECPELVFEADWSQAGNKLTFRRRAEFRAVEVLPETYEAFRKVVMALERIDRSGIVLVPEQN